MKDGSGVSLTVLDEAQSFHFTIEEPPISINTEKDPNPPVTSGWELSPDIVAKKRNLGSSNPTMKDDFLMQS